MLFKLQKLALKTAKCSDSLHIKSFRKMLFLDFESDSIVCSRGRFAHFDHEHDVIRPVKEESASRTNMATLRRTDTKPIAVAMWDELSQ